MVGDSHAGAPIEVRVPALREPVGDVAITSWRCALGATLIYGATLIGVPAGRAEPRHPIEGSIVTLEASDSDPAAADRSSDVPAGRRAESLESPIRGSAAALVRHMEESLQIPTATTMRTFPVAALDPNRARMPAGSDRISASRMIAFALVRAAVAVPAIRQRFVRDGAGPARVTDAGVHLGIAVDVQRRDGTRHVVVPVIHDADALDLAEFVRAYDALVAAARAGRLRADQLISANLILTNTGAFGSTTGVPRLPAGPGAIVAVGAVGYPPGLEAVGGRLGLNRICTVSCTYDHRVIQGADSGAYLQKLAGLLGADSELYPALASRPSEVEKALDDAAFDPVADRAAAQRVVDEVRRNGHRVADLNPLCPRSQGLDDLVGAEQGETCARVAAGDAGLHVGLNPVGSAFEHLHRTYCGHLAIEVGHLAASEEQDWWYRQVEGQGVALPASAEERVEILEQLIAMDTLETFMQRVYPGEKTLSVQGVDTTVLMARELTRRAVGAGCPHVSIGMAHRGRLNLLAHVLGVPYDRLFAEFEAVTNDGALDHVGITGDVKQHIGAHTVVQVRGEERTATLALLPNPSHLEYVSPVTLGATRARQDAGTAASARGRTGLAILLHGDAAFTGQGIVTETLNLHKLAGFGVAGAMHILQDNQIGFTTEAGELRSTRWPSDIAKGYDIPIVHVNADDPEACLRAVELALACRERYAKDVLLHVVGYRRLGHSETDEPTFTQPEMYRRIAAHPPVAGVYASQLVDGGVVDAEFATSCRARVEAQLRAARERARQVRARGSVVETGAAPELDATRTEMAASAERIATVGRQLLELPDGFAVHPKVNRMLQRRRSMLDRGQVDWAHAETLALALVAAAGVPVRFTGQDIVRGAFTQRHLALWPSDGGSPYSPLLTAPATRNLVQVFNSPLSEAAILGFEYGYSLGRPEALVIWEAQFGDFANGAQVIIDQFLSSGHAKWGVRSRLVLLLPHGYEGSGPEHSSARLERYLQLAAEANLQVAVPSTPAQYFHLLGDQATVDEPCPLALLTPKSLLRHKAAVSDIAELADGRFVALLTNQFARRPSDVRRALLCTGKVSYELNEILASVSAEDAVVVRLERLYPFPTAELVAALCRYPKLQHVTWVQEEPENMGAARYVNRMVAESGSLPGGVTLDYIGRPPRAAVAEGYPAAHRSAQAGLLDEALQRARPGVNGE